MFAQVTLKDEICLRDQDFQELRTKRDDADRQLSRVRPTRRTPAAGTVRTWMYMTY